MIDDAKKKMLKQLIKQMHGRMAEEEGIEVEAPEMEPEDQHVHEQEDGGVTSPPMPQEGEEMDEEGLRSMLKDFFSKDDGIGPASPKVGKPLMSMTEIEVIKPKKKGK